MAASGKFSKAVDDARSYAMKHDLERLVTQMANNTGTMQPKDPRTFMIRWLLERCDKDQQKAAGIKIVKEMPLRPTGQGERSRAAYERHLAQVRKSRGEPVGSDITQMTGSEEGEDYEAAAEEGGVN